MDKPVLSKTSSPASVRLVAVRFEGARWIRDEDLTMIAYVLLCTAMLEDIVTFEQLT
jgi:hypothetical protein